MRERGRDTQQKVPHRGPLHGTPTLPTEFNGAPLILFLTSLIQHINRSERSRSAILSSKKY